MRDRDDGGTGWVDVLTNQEACNGTASVVIPDEPPSMVAGMSYLVRCEDDSHRHQAVVCTSPSGESRTYDIRDSHPHGDDRPFYGYSRLSGRWDFERFRVPQLQAKHAPQGLRDAGGGDNEITLPPRRQGAPYRFHRPVGEALAGDVRSAVLKARSDDSRLEAVKRQREPGDDDDEPLPWEE